MHLVHCHAELGYWRPWEEMLELKVFDDTDSARVDRIEEA